MRKQNVAARQRSEAGRRAAIRGREVESAHELKLQHYANGLFALEEFQRDSKFLALEIILLSPLWPKRNDLSPAGQALFDRIITDAKPYALAVTSGRFDEALALASGWTSLVNVLIDGERIERNEPAQRMLAVYRHYADALVDWRMIEKAI